MENETGKLRTGSADREKYEDGMLIRFAGDLAEWSDMDMLIVETPNGKSLSLQPEATKGGAHTARLRMEDHQVSLLADHYARVGFPSAR